MENASQKKSRKWRERIAFALGNLGHSAFYGALSTYFIVFVTSGMFDGVEKSIANKLIGLITGLVVIIRLAEVLVDPVIGNVVGIVYAKSSSVSIEGIGYAIPVNNIKDLVAQMINDPDSVKDQTKGSQIMLGITIRDITEEMSKQYSMPVGVYITEVSSMSAAERAGLQKGDIITEFAGETVTSADDLNAIKAKQTSGDTVSVKIDRNGKTLTLDLVVPQPTDVDTSSIK